MDSQELQKALRVLNEAAHAAEKAARKSRHGSHHELRQIMWRTDTLVDGVVQ